MIDPKINVESGQAKQIAQIITAEIKSSFDANRKIYDRAKRCENQYNQVSRWMELGKVCEKPWPGAADYFVALSEWIVDAIYARLMSILFSQEPYMKAKGMDSASIANQDNATDFVDTIFREKVRLYENINFFFKQMIKLPFAVLKYEWAQDYDGQIKQEQAQSFVGPDGSQQLLLPDDPEAMTQAAQFIANGYQPGQPQAVWTYEDVEIYDDPKLQYINIDDYVWAPNTKRGAKPYWEGDRCWFTLNEMRLKVRQEKFMPESVSRIQQTAFGGYSGTEAVIKQRETPIECFHWWGRLPFNANNEIDFSDSEAVEQEAYCLVSLKEQELLQILRWPYERYPKEDRVYIRGLFEETREFEGRSMLEKLYKTQQEVNDLHNTIMNNAWIAMQKIFVKRKTLQGDGYERPKVFPGAMWEEDQSGDMRVLDVGDVKSIGLELEQTLLSFAERISNISNWNLGSKDTGGKATATEFAGVMQEGNIGREPLLQRCYKILSKICDWTIDYYKGRIEPGMERSIKDDMGNTLMPTQENMPQYQQRGVNSQWQDQDFSGQFEWNWQGTSLNSDKQWNIMVDNELMDRYMPHPMVGQNLMAVWTIMKKGLIDRGIKNWEEILPPREAVIKEMQNMQVQAQVRQRQVQSPKTEQIAVKKLVDKGMPPQKAIQAVQERLQAQNAGAV